jgi:hypothetical protein
MKEMLDPMQLLFYYPIPEEDSPLDNVSLSQPLTMAYKNGSGRDTHLTLKQHMGGEGGLVFWQLNTANTIFSKQPW